MIRPLARRCLLPLLVAGLLTLAGAGSAQAQVGQSCQPATISGVAQDAETLVARRGSCSGVPQPSVRLRWFLCDAQQQNCVARGAQSGVNPSSFPYTVTAADVNGRLVVQQVARNLLGQIVDQDNTATDVVAAIPPSATPRISGRPREGEQLTGSEGFLSGTDPAVTAVQWLRCEADGATCVAIPGATTRRYTLTADDAGRTIRFRVTVTGPQQSVDVDSPQTSAIEGLPAPPVPGQPAPTPQPPAPTPRRPSAPRPLQPFPSVVIAGRAFEGRATVSTLLVRGPRGALVTVVCRGRACPVRRQRFRIRGGAVRLRRFQRSLAAGTVIVIRVTSENRIGKFTRLRILRDRAPARTDLCVRPGRSGPVNCPAGVG